MSCCARCGQGICTTSGKIALNKVWHRDCFSCYNCNRPLRVNTAKIYYGEVFCSCCCPQTPNCPLKVCRVNSTPSFDGCNKIITPLCCKTVVSDEHPQPRDTHSCSCIPACCSPHVPPYTCIEDERCFKRIHYPPRSLRGIKCPPTQKPKCGCLKCCPKPSKRPSFQDSCYPIVRKKVNYCPGQCQEVRKNVFYCRPCGKEYSKLSCDHCCQYKICERCTRCGEKVFAAEKVLTSCGPFHLGCFSCYCCCKSLCMKSMYESCGEIYCKQCYNANFGINSYGYSCC